jgi:phage-related protein
MRYNKLISRLHSVMSEKPIYWFGSSREDISDFSEGARREAGFALWKVQQGQPAPDFKPMPIVGPGVQEIRIRTEDAYRIFYIAKFEEAIYVLHVFQKKTQKTTQNDIQIGQRRFKELLHLRKQQEP